jgi:hypothetical protein
MDDRRQTVSHDSLQRAAFGRRHVAVEWWLCSVLAGALGVPADAYQDCANQVISPSDLGPSDGFGNSVDADSGWLVVGAPSHTVQFNNDGAAYVYQLVGHQWILDEKILSPDPVPNAVFGIFVAISYPWLFLHQRTHLGGSAGIGDDRTLEVYQHNGSDWVHVQTLAPPPNSASPFGLGPDASGTRMISTGWDDAHALAIFDLVGGTWTLSATLTYSDLAPYSLPIGEVLVNYLALEGDRIVLGHTSNYPAHVLEFDGNGWSTVAELDPPFSYSSLRVGIVGGDVFVGEPHWGSQQGRVAVFRETAGTWSLVQELGAANPENFSRFGTYFKGAGDELLVAAHLADSGGVQNSGAGYWLRRSGGVWTELARLDPEPALLLEYAGNSIALDGGYAHLGAPDGPSGFTGSARAFPLPRDLGVPYGDTTPNSSGLPATLRARGSAWTEHDCLRFEATQLPPGQVGYLLMGDVQGYAALPNPSQGLLHLGLPIVRFSNDVLQADAGGEAGFEPSLTALPQGTLLSPGETWSFQYWFRDANPGATSNTTNALALTFAASGDPRVQFPVSVLRRDEATTQFQVTVTLSHPATQTVQIPFTVGGTATDQVDWRVETTSPLVVARGDVSVPVTITLADDALQEGDETAIVTLLNPSGAVLGTQPSLTLTIVDND